MYYAKYCHSSQGCVWIIVSSCALSTYWVMLHQLQKTKTEGNSKWWQKMTTEGSNGKWQQQKLIINGDGSWLWSLMMGNNYGRCWHRMTSVDGNSGLWQQMAMVNGHGTWQCQMAMWQCQLDMVDADARWLCGIFWWWHWMATWNQQMAMTGCNGRWHQQMALAIVDSKFQFY